MDSYPVFNYQPLATQQADLNQFRQPVIPDISRKTGRELIDWAYRFWDEKGWQEIQPHEMFGIRDPESGTLRIVTFHPDENGDRTVLRCHIPSDQSVGWQLAAAAAEGKLASPAQTGHQILECQFLPFSAALAADVALVARDGDPDREEIPCFRSTRPGFYPWFVEEKEAALLTIAFKLFHSFHNEVLPRREVFFQWEHPFGPRPGIPVFHLAGEGRPDELINWEIEMEVLPSKCLAPVKPRPGKDPHIDQLAGKRVLNETWEIASFFVPLPVFEGSRPYFPKSAVCLRAVDVGSRCPCAPILYGGDDPRGDTEVIREAFRELASHCNYLPERIKVDSEIAHAALENYADRFGIELISDGEQEFMPVLIEEVLAFFEKALPNPDEELLNHIVKAIPEEFRSTVAGGEDLEDSVSRLAARLAAEGDDKFALFEIPPANVVFGDFSPQRAEANQVD